MKTRIFVALVACLALVSCERVRKFVAKARGSVTEEAGKEAPAEEQAVPMDPVLAKQVDRTEEGVLFRRDLPFPREVKVVLTEKEPIAVRLIQQSEVGKQVETVHAERRQTMEIRGNAGAVRFSRFKEEYFPGEKTEKDMVPKPIQGHPLLPPSPPKDHAMVFRSGGWEAMTKTGFAEVALAQQLGPVMPALIQEYGLAPRPMWFGKRRIVPGKPMEISGELLPMLVAGKATGALTITLEDIESVYGHPCGRFAIKGSYQRKGFPLPDGRLFDEETSIQSGHIWLSVLHPVVLKYRVERIVTFAVAEGSGPAIRFQGSTRPMRALEWKAEG